MKGKKELDVQDVIMGVTHDSSAHGYGYGQPSRLPVVDNSSVLYEESCQNEVCKGRSVQFEHIVNKYEDADLFKNGLEYVFTWDVTLETFKLTGHICPICGDCEVSVDGEVVHSEVGGMQTE